MKLRQAKKILCRKKTILETTNHGLRLWLRQRPQNRKGYP